MEIDKGAKCRLPDGREGRPPIGRRKNIFKRKKVPYDHRFPIYKSEIVSNQIQTLARTLRSKGLEESLENFLILTILGLTMRNNAVDVHHIQI